MSYNTGPKIVTDGLVLCLDAADRNSYPGSGSTWYDLSGYSQNMTILGGAGISTFDGATAFDLNADGKCFDGTILSANQPTTNATLEAWIYPAASEVTDGDRGTVILLRDGQSIYMSWNKSNQKLSNYWYSHNPAGYHETSAASTRETWTHWCSVWNYTDGKLYQFVDGRKKEVSTVGNAATGTNLKIGRESSARQFSGGIASVKIYNVALTDAQVIQNYNATKGRFGL